MKKFILLTIALVAVIITWMPETIHAASCKGTTPVNATLCANDNKSVTIDTQYSLVDQCSDAKCEYVCKSGFVRSGSKCVQCKGVIPTNAMLCDLDDQGLPADTQRTVVEDCTTDAKCEYVCNGGFFKYNNTCVGCTGVTPANAALCSDDDQGLTKNFAKAVVLNGCTNKTKCEYTCNAGFAKDPKTQNCVYPCMGTPANASLCSGDDQGVTTASGSTVKSTCTNNVKCEYTCNAGFAKDPKIQNCVYPCIGTPANAALCSDDDKNVQTALSSTVKEKCSDKTKCEYTCNTGFAKEPNKNNCVYPCMGTPTNASLCSGDDQGVTTALTSTVKSACSSKAKCEYTCNAGFAKDPKSQNCVYPCLNAPTTTKATMCDGDDQNIGATAIASTVKEFGSACTSKKCEFVCKKDYVLSSGKCIPKQCSGNQNPLLSMSDPECWTSRVTGSQKCEWKLSFTQVGCSCPPNDGSTDYRRNVDETCDTGCVDGTTFYNYEDGCGGTHCTNNPTYPETWNQTWSIPIYAYDCHYTAVNAWGECDYDTGVQLAVDVEQKIVANSKDCTNLSQSTVRYCGICGDSVKEADEGCDDGNRVDYDGCSSTCKIEMGGDPIDNPYNPSYDVGNNEGDGIDVKGRMIEVRP